ncbi:MAG TPA: hypothetical protein VFU06_02015 [Longimicrobiales bacterium]|nr:hypothetical protein [Longimicrobiales bacterium]
MHLRSYSRRLLAVATVFAAGASAACDSFNSLLEVENPGVIGEPALGDENLMDAMVASTIGEFQLAYDDLALAGAILTDEAVNGHNFDQWRQFDLRYVEHTNSILASDIYEPIQLARGAADDYARRLGELLGEDADSDIRLARVHAYGGYSYVMLGEYFCESPVDPESPALSSAEILALAIDHFDAAIAIATAADEGAASDSIIAMARVGAARAHLWRGETAQAIAYASQVPADFASYVSFSSATADPNNRMQAATTGASQYLGVDEAFRNLNDPRVTHIAEPVRGHNGLTDLYTPFQPPSYSEWVAGEQVPFALGTDIRFTSGLEARYIVAEAQGLTVDNLAFLNERRGVGGQGAILIGALTEDGYQAELRDQRRRDFYLDGHRLGDLRRYIDQYGVDEFPSGAHPNTEWGSYGTATCFVPHNNERIGNPSY